MKSKYRNRKKLILTDIDGVACDWEFAFNIWMQEPNFSNSVGQVSFEGAILNPGYQGSAGQVLSVVFK